MGEVVGHNTDRCELGVLQGCMVVINSATAEFFIKMAVADIISAGVKIRFSFNVPYLI